MSSYMFRLNLLLWLRRGWLFVVIVVASGLVITIEGFLVPATQREIGEVTRSVVKNSLTKPASARILHIEGKERPTVEVLLQNAPPNITLVEMLWSQAAHESLQLSKIDYRQERNDAGQYEALRVSVPVVGAYPALKRYVFQLLGRFPTLSLDGIEISRPSAESQELKAVFKFSYFYKVSK